MDFAGCAGEGAMGAENRGEWIGEGGLILSGKVGRWEEY